jgi:hypothetical protein
MQQSAASLWCDVWTAFDQACLVGMVTRKGLQDNSGPRLEACNTYISLHCADMGFVIWRSIADFVLRACVCCPQNYWLT